MGRMTPTQQSHLIDIANSTVGVTELVLLTTVVDDRGVKISKDDIMSENNLVNPASVPVVVDGVAAASVNNSEAPASVATSTPIVVTEDGTTVEQPSSSPYIDLYQDP